MSVLALDVATGAPLDVRRVVVREAVSELFDLTIVARCTDPSLDLAAIVDQPAAFRIVTGLAGALHRERRWVGICRAAELERAEPSGLSTYRFHLVPALWRLTQRRNHRVFQHRSALEIAVAMLDGWGVPRALAIAEGAAHPKLPYKVQYAETDHAFFCRVLEEAGLAFTFPDGVLTLGDALHAGASRGPIAYVSSPNESAEEELVSEVRLTRDLRPGAYTLRDHDLRRPGYPLFAEAEKAPSEAVYEQYHYRPGAFLAEVESTGETPAADAMGAARHDRDEGRRRAERALAAERADKNAVAYRTNVLDLWPGRIVTLAGHPHPDLHEARRLLVTELSFEGAPGEDWTVRGKAVFADSVYRPPLKPTRPRARVQSATVWGRTGDPIETDELGRVRVEFPWARDGGQSTIWLRVSHGWAGAGYGMITLPRVGQEVLVDFLEGDPEQPVIVGRVFNRTNPVIDKLPEHDTRSAWKSDQAGGFNELFLEDKKGSELVFARAERDARRLIKHDDTSTVVHDREKFVGVSERETTEGNRIQATSGDRVELTDRDQTTAVEGTRRDKVTRDEIERLEDDQRVNVGRDLHGITRGVKRELIERDAHLRIGGNRPESVGGTDSLTVGKLFGESVGSYTVMALGPEGTIHLLAGSAIVIESATEVTVKGAGGFVKVDGGGVTIVGAEVVINEGGSPGSLPGGGAKLPELPRTAVVVEPAPPTIDATDLR